MVLSCIPGTAAYAQPQPSSTASPTTTAVPPSTPAPASGHATFGIGPVTNNHVDSRPNFRWVVTPGATLDDTVGIVNIGRTPLTLDVYGADAANAKDGSFTLLPKTRPAVDAGRWMTLHIPHHATSVTVPARSLVIVPVSLDVPRNASPGDHSAGIVASLTSYVTNRQNARIKLEQRVAVRVFVRVSGPLHPKLSVEALDAGFGGPLSPFSAGGTTVTYRVHNTGNVNLAGLQSVSVRGLFGSTEHATAPKLPLLIPGGTAEFRVHVHGVYPEFLMAAGVHITPLVPVGDVDPSLSSFSGDTSFWAIPWILVALLLALATLLLAYLQRRRRAADERASRWAPGRRRATSSARGGRHGKHVPVSGTSYGATS